MTRERNDVLPGQSLRRVAWLGTAAFALSATAGIFSSPIRLLAAMVAGVLFVVGAALFLWAFGVAVGRSRTDAIGIGGLYFLAGSTAPRSVRRSLMGALAVQTLVGLVSAGSRPYTVSAFGILVPMFGLGVAGLWGARYGSFGPRADR